MNACFVKINGNKRSNILDYPSMRLNKANPIPAVFFLNLFILNFA